MVKAGPENVEYMHICVAFDERVSAQTEDFWIA
jgi:hypothetical protein